MAGRAVWRGSIRFGDTSVPVKLHPAVREERIGFHLLHRRDGVRLQQWMICAYDKKPVPTEARVRGFEVEDGKFILVGAEELGQLAPAGDREITVHEFVPSGEIDPVFLERVHYLAPDGLPVGYGALAEVLGELGAAGICTWTMRKRAHYGALQARGRILRLTILRHADEVMAVSSLGLGEMPVSEREVAIGQDLIRRMTAPFDPGKYENVHNRKLLQFIEKKARGEKISVLRPMVLEPTSPDRLLEALKASLKKVA